MRKCRERHSDYEYFMRAAEKLSLAEFKKLETQYREALWSVIVEKYAASAMIIAAPFLISAFGLIDAAERFGIRLYAKHTGSYSNVDEAILFSQMFFLFWLLLLLRLVAIGILAIPKFIICEVLPRVRANGLLMSVKLYAFDALLALENKIRDARHSLSPTHKRSTKKELRP